MIRVMLWTLGASPTPQSVATVVARLSPDVLLLPDAPSRAGLRRALAGTNLSTLVRSGRGRASSAICASERVQLRTAAELSLEASGSTRVASHAIATVAGRQLSLLAFRLTADPAGRLADAEQVATFLDSVDADDVVGGDLGEGPGGPVSETLLGSRLDAWTVGGVGTGHTYPTPDPIARHDVVLVDAGIPVLDARVESAAPVDVAARHRPVVVDLEEHA